MYESGGLDDVKLQIFSDCFCLFAVFYSNLKEVFSHIFINKKSKKKGLKFR